MRIRLMALLICAVAGVTGCGVGASSGGHSTTQTVASGATLACTFHERPQEADTVTVGIACTVTGVGASDTSFSVQHTVTGPKGQGTAVDATCSGPVREGVGACSVTFTEQSTEAEPGTLAGELLPSNTPLGPVKPGIIP